MRRVLGLIAVLCALCAANARAEVIQLLDNTQVAGKLVHYYDGVFVIETADGNKVELPTTKIKSITFKLPPPRADFSTPDKTFNRWRDAVTKGDAAKIIDCYALMYQGLVGQQLAQGEAAMKNMQHEVQGVKFEIKGSKISGSNATLKVQRSKGEDVETAEIHLVLENGEWKMTP